MLCHPNLPHDLDEFKTKKPLTLLRFKCKFEPLNTTNTYSIDLSGDENIESFSNILTLFQVTQFL